MANEKKDHTFYDPFYHNHHDHDQLNDHSAFSFNQAIPSQNFQGFDDPSNASFTDYLHGSMDYNTLSRAFDSEMMMMSSSSTKKLSSAGDSLVEISENQSTKYNSSESLSSNEADQAVTEEDSTKSINNKDKEPKGCEDHGENVEKSKKE